MIMVSWWETGSTIIQVALNPQNGKVLCLFYKNIGQQNRQSSLASAGSSLAWLQPVNYWNNISLVLSSWNWSLFHLWIGLVCRALGIPARSITNFSSAHDTHGGLTIDTFIGDDGKVVEELNSDSIWNFHVWNEYGCRDKIWLNFFSSSDDLE